MIKKYIIDGNNLIGKIKRLAKIQRNEPQAAREHLVPILDRYFAAKKVEVSLHLDGFKNGDLKSSSANIFYSNNRPADSAIKKEIEKSKTPRQICVISSDHELINFAKVCGCKAVTSESFSKNLFSNSKEKSEEELIKSINNNEIKRAFGLN